MNCPNCGEYTSWRYRRCPHCQAPTPQPKEPEVAPEAPSPDPGPMPGTAQPERRTSMLGTW